MSKWTMKQKSLRNLHEQKNLSFNFISFNGRLTVYITRNNAWWPMHRRALKAYRSKRHSWNQILKLLYKCPWWLVLEVQASSAELRAQCTDLVGRNPILPTGAEQKITFVALWNGTSLQLTLKNREYLNFVKKRTLNVGKVVQLYSVVHITIAISEELDKERQR